MIQEELLKLLAGGAGIPAVIALVEVVKLFLPADVEVKWKVLAALILGVLVNLFVCWLTGGDYRVAAGTGVLVGLAAAKIYEWAGHVETTKQLDALSIIVQRAEATYYTDRAVRFDDPPIEVGGPLPPT